MAETKANENKIVGANLTLNFNTFEEVWKVSDDCQRLIIRLYK